MIVKSSRAALEPESVRTVGRNASPVARPAATNRNTATNGAATKRVVPGKAKAQQATAPNSELTSEQIAQQRHEQQIAIAQNTQQLVANLQKLVQDEVSHRNMLLADFQHLAIELGTAIASRICQKKIEENEYPLREIVSTITARLGLDQPITVYLHPQDVVSVESAFEDDSNEAHIHFLPDTGLQRGECHAGNAETGLVATVDLQVAEIRQLLLEGINDARFERRNAGE